MSGGAKYANELVRPNKWQRGHHGALWRRRAVRALLALAACVLSIETGAAPPPVIRLDDPFVSTIWRVGIDSRGQKLVAGLSSGSLAMWDLDSLGGSRLLHLPVRDEEARRAHAIAISPDGQVIAYGVPPLRSDQGFAIPNTARIYIVNADTLRIERQIDDVPTRAQDLKFSYDGQYLGAALSGGCGIRIWHRSDWSLYASDDAGYAGRGASEKTCVAALGPSRDSLPDTLSLAFAQTGPVWLVSSGNSGVRTYARGSGAISPLRFMPGEKLGIEVPDGIAISPSGRQVAIGDRRLRRPDGKSVQGVVVVDLESMAPSSLRLELKSSDLRFPERIDPKAFPDARQFNLSRVVWGTLRGEEWVFGAGSFPCIAAVEEAILADKPNHLSPTELCAVGWRIDGSVGSPRFFPVGSDQANDIAIAPTRATLVVVSDREVARFARSDSPAIDSPRATQGWIRGRVVSAAADFRSRGLTNSERLDFSVSSDASVVQLQTYLASEGAASTFRFDVKSLTVGESRMAGDDLHKPAVDDPAIETLESWVNSSRFPKINGRSNPVGEVPWDVYRSAIALPNRLVALSSANFLRVMSHSDDQTRQLCALRITSEGFRLNASSDGTTIVVAHGDGTVRWYRLAFSADRGACKIENTLSVHFRRVDTDKDWAWIAWKPNSGEFATDPRVRSLLFWQLGDQDCRTALVAFGSLTRDLYDRAAIQTALNASQVGTKVPDSLDRFCNSFKASIVAPKVHSRVRTPQIPFKIAVTGLSRTAGRDAPLYVTLGGSERLAKSVNGKFFAPDDPVLLSGDGEYSLDVTMPTRLPESGSDFHICFHVQQDRDCHLLVWDGPRPALRSRQLWAVLIGISDYGLHGTSDVRSLRFAQNDAIDLANVFLGDHNNQAAAAGQGKPSKVDYANVSLNLFLAPSPSTDSAKELDELKTRPGVSTGATSAPAIYEALARVADRIRTEGSADDLFILHFSGHGLAAHSEQVKGSSVLLLPSPRAEETVGLAPESYLDSKELLDRLAKINANKLVVFDSCRNVSFDPKAPAFDSAKMRHEFEANVPSASILFATSAGYGSIETERYFFNKGRSEGSRGNGLFSYALLSGLTESRSKESSKEFDRPEEVTVLDLWNYVSRYFNRERTADPVMFRQRPVYVPPRVGDPVVIRSIEVMPESVTLQ